MLSLLQSNLLVHGLIDVCGRGLVAEDRYCGSAVAIGFGGILRVPWMLSGHYWEVWKGRLFSEWYCGSEALPSFG